MEDNKMIVYDEQGNEIEMEIMFTFDDDNHNSYVIFFNPKDEDENVYAGKYNEDGQLDTELTEEEFAMCQEVLGAFEDEEEN